MAPFWALGAVAPLFETLLWPNYSRSFDHLSFFLLHGNSTRFLTSGYKDQGWPLTTMQGYNDADFKSSLNNKGSYRATCSWILPNLSNEGILQGRTFNLMYLLVSAIHYYFSLNLSRGLVFRLSFLLPFRFLSRFRSPQPPKSRVLLRKCS